MLIQSSERVPWSQHNSQFDSYRYNTKSRPWAPASQNTILKERGAHMSHMDLQQKRFGR